MSPLGFNDHQTMRVQADPIRFKAITRWVLSYLKWRALEPPLGYVQWHHDPDAFEGS
jgi:hypothetical protein